MNQLTKVSENSRAFCNKTVNNFLLHVEAPRETLASGKEYN